MAYQELLGRQSLFKKAMMLHNLRAQVLICMYKDNIIYI